MAIVARDIPPGTAPWEIAPPDYEFPFLQNGDSTTFIVTRFYKQKIADYNADRLAARYLPGVQEDREHSGCYMISESKAIRTDTALVSFTRSFSKVPLSQSVPSSLFVTKPPITGTVPQELGTSVIIQPDTTVAKYDAYTIQTATGDSGPSGNLIGGTFTITYSSQTTSALAYNASAATVETALDALGKITAAGGVTVTGDATAGYAIEFATPTAATMNTGSLTSSGGSITSVVYTAIGVDDRKGFTQAAQISTGVGNTFTGGTFTITILGQTTSAIAYNANTATVAAALNALSNFAAYGWTATVSTISGTSIYTGSYVIAFNILISVAVFTATSSLLPSTSTITIADTPGTYAYIFHNLQTITLAGGSANPRIVSCTAHGFTTASTLYIRATDYHAGITGFTVVDANNIQLPAAYQAVAGLITEIGARFFTDYAPGVSLSRSNRVTDFFLPGVTPGIVTAADIPLPVYQGDAASMLTAIFTGDTEINYEVGELSQWRDSPILQRTTTTLNASTL